MTDDSPPPASFYRTAATFYFLLAVAGVIWIGLDSRTIPLRLLAVPDQLLVDALLGLAAGIFLVGIAWLARRWPPVRTLEERVSTLLAGVTQSEAIAIALISGFSEELFFRGAVQGSWGVLWATVLFALMHMGPDRLIGWWTLFALAAGAIFAGLTVYRGTLLPAILAHVTVNMVGLLRLLPDSTDEPTAAC